MKEIQKDKHGFTVIKHKFSLRLFLKFILTAVVCIYALYRCSLRANAADSTSIRLTPEQTVALYGTQITALFDNTTEVTFHYFGTSGQFVGSGEYGASIPVLSVANVSTSNSTYYKSVLNSAEFVYYSATFRNFQYQNANRFTFTLNPMLRGITGYEGQFLFSTGGYNYSASNASRSSSAMFNTSQGVKTINTAMGYSYIAVGRTTNEPVPALGNPSNDSIFSFSFTSAMGVNSVEFSGTPQYDLQSIIFTWGSAGGIVNSAVTGGYTTLYFGIQCPTISNYVPPVITTTTVVTTRPSYSVLPPQSTKNAETVDLSNLESGVAAIVQQGIEANISLDWIGSNIYIGVNNLAHIANTLDSIYNEMWKAGEIPLNEGLSPPTNENLMNFMQSALATHTNTVTGTTYDLQGGMSSYFDIGNSLLSSPLFRPFVLVAAVGLALAVMAFVLFRGY